MTASPPTAQQRRARSIGPRFAATLATAAAALSAALSAALPAALPAVLLVVLLVAPLAAHGQDAAGLLARADRFRSAATDIQVDVTVDLLDAAGASTRERRYRVLLQAGRKSLVLMQSPAERGQKVLMLGDDFWLVMPGSARPLRITPMQKLLGDASIGDVATMRWTDDYGATLGEQTVCDGVACRRLSLVATRKGVTYQRIELWIGTAHGEPLAADLYVQSDKLAKQARFVADDAARPQTVVEMRLTDRLARDRVTRVRYGEQKARSAPAEWFNPMFLATNPRLD